MLAESCDLDDGIVNEKANLMSKLEDLAAEEIADLKQKAKSKWVLEGDENSRFFHGIIPKKIKNNRIYGLNVNGVWKAEAEIMKEEVYNFFKSKFSDDNPIRPIHRSNLFKKLTREHSEWIEVPFSVEEIKEAVWSYGNNKAPGTEGFTFVFIRRFWDKIGRDICDVVKFFESNPFIN